MTLPAGTKAGLVGRNGTGKTTLFRAITGDLSAETGSVSLPRNTRIGQVAQEVRDGKVLELRQEDGSRDVLGGHVGICQVDTGVGAGLGLERLVVMHDRET